MYSLFVILSMAQDCAFFIGLLISFSSLFLHLIFGKLYLYPLRSTLLEKGKKIQTVLSSIIKEKRKLEKLLSFLSLKDVDSHLYLLYRRYLLLSSMLHS